MADAFAKPTSSKGFSDERHEPARTAGDGRCNVPCAGASTRRSGGGLARGDAAWSGDARRVAVRRAQRARPERPAAGDGHRSRRRCSKTRRSSSSSTRCSTGTRASSATSPRRPRRSACSADLLAAAVNPNVGAWTLSPAATEIEAQTVRWIAELIGYPADGRRAALERRQHGQRDLLHGGARGARRLGRARARRRRRRRTPAARLRLDRDPHVAPEGRRPGGPRHRVDPLDSDRRRSCAWTCRRCGGSSTADTASGDVPCLVVGTAGSVSTGAVDPLREIAALCQAAPRVVPRRRRVRRLRRRRARRVRPTCAR